MNKAQSEVEYIKAARELQEWRVKASNVLVRKQVLAVLHPHLRPLRRKPQAL
jgi:hypothetical protein